MFDDIIAIIDYVSSDQEKEGRELGIKKATSMYKPILESLELKQKKLIKELDDESISFSSKAELLKQSVMNIECETEKWKNNMRLNRSYSKFSTIIKENKSGAIMNWSVGVRQFAIIWRKAITKKNKRKHLTNVENCGIIKA